MNTQLIAVRILIMNSSICGIITMRIKLINSTVVQIYGKYYSSPLSTKQRTVQRILYVLLYVISVALFIISGCRDIPVNHTLIPSFFVALCIFPLAWLALPLFRNLTAPKEMIIRQYRASSLDLIRVSGITAVALIVPALVNLVSLIIIDGPLLETIMCSFGYLVAAGLMFVLRFLEQHLKYKITPPRASRPEHSTIIEFESAVQRF